jgi:hypothetical protein
LPPPEKVPDSARLRLPPPSAATVAGCCLKVPLVHEGESHPGVGTAAAMDGAPTGVGGQDLRRTGAVLGCEKVSSRNDLALGVRAEPPLNELVESHKVKKKLESRVRNLSVRAVPDHVAASEVGVPEERRNNENLPVAAHRQDSLQVGNCCRHGYLVCDNQLAHHMILVIIQFHDLRDHTIAVSLAEGRIIQAIYNHWSLWWEGQAVGFNLRKHCGH